MKLRELYFEWMYRIVCGKSNSYRRLLYFLFETEFTYEIPMDENRYDDGIELRYRFGYEEDIQQPQIASELDIYPCSVLEMMIALAIRLEEHIMSNSDLGDRTSKWFFYMLASLGLDDMRDDIYNEALVENTIERFLHRAYAPNGDGGLFYISDCDKDVRRVQIWDQAMWYLNTQL